MYMHTTRTAARQQRRRRRIVRRWLPLALAVTACGAYLLVPDRDAGAGHVTVTSATDGRATVLVTKTPPASSTSPAATRTPPPEGPSSPSAGTATASPRPSATGDPGARSARAPLAGRIRPHVTYPGVATAYDARDGDGACLFGPSPDLMIAAMNTTDYESSKACGAYVLVHAANGASVTVRITNECPRPCAPGQLDLSGPAFAKLADPSLGRIPITWQLLSPAATGTVSIRYKTGSTRWWCGIQVLGHRNPVARLEVRTSGGWRTLPRTAYNYFLSADGAGCGGAIRMTDIYGERLSVSGITLRPNVAQPTRVQFAEH